MALSLAVQESYWSPRAVPCGEEDSLYACGPIRVNVNVSLSDFSILCKEPHRPDLLASTQCMSCSLFQNIGLSPCISVSGLLCQLFVFCRSRCEPGPIPIFLVMLPNRSCLFAQFCTKYYISVVLAQWRQVPPENTVLTLCSYVFVRNVPNE